MFPRYVTPLPGRWWWTRFTLAMASPRPPNGSPSTSCLMKKHALDMRMNGSSHWLQTVRVHDGRTLINSCAPQGRKQPASQEQLTFRRWTNFWPVRPPFSNLGELANSGGRVDFYARRWLASTEEFFNNLTPQCAAILNRSDLTEELCSKCRLPTITPLLVNMPKNHYHITRWCVHMSTEGSHAR